MADWPRNERAPTKESDVTRNERALTGQWQTGRGTCVHRGGDEMERATSADGGKEKERKKCRREELPNGCGKGGRGQKEGVVSK